jgi:endonuclease/exonuclease/phosphatase family metal-dependent hydrolase
MTTNPFIRRRIADGKEVQEPTVLAIVLTLAGCALVLAVCVVAMAGLPAFGSIGWTFAAVAAILVCLVLGMRRNLPSEGTSPTARQQWLLRIRDGSRWVLVTVLACWLGLIAWSAVCRGGPTPPAKKDPAAIRVITWNIHCGQDAGPPWKRFDWPARKHSLRAAIDEAQPDILCVQEATPVQVGFLEGSLSGYRRVGIGRDGESGGEHCAIFFNAERFTQIGGSTFWLEEPIDEPRAGSALDVKRICTWVRLRDRITGNTLRVYNTHLYLTESPRRKAAELILAHIAAGDPADSVVLTGDFNASPSAPSRRLFLNASLTDSAVPAGKPAGKATFQLYGIGLWCIDGILVDRHWHVEKHLVVKVKPNNVFPSDHFGLLSDLVMTDQRPSRRR